MISCPCFHPSFTTSAASLFLLLFWNTPSADAQAALDWRVLTSTGVVQMRAESALAWSEVKTGHTLQLKTTLRSGKNSNARLQNAEGKIFVLPGHAQIVAHELQQYTREEVVLALTALELQRLPTRGAPTQSPKSAFILHGAAPDSATSNMLADKYIQQEERGAFALFEQGYLGGFILKWNRLTHLFPAISSERAESALIEAYTALGMPLRAQQAREHFKQRRPQAALPE